LKKGNNACFDFFPSAKLENLAAPTSDHYPILLDHSPVVRPPGPNTTFDLKMLGSLNRLMTHLVIT